MAGMTQSSPPGCASVTITSQRGRDVTVRHIRPEDSTLLIELFHLLSSESRRLRFMMLRPDLPDDLIAPHAGRLARIDPAAEVALIALAHEQGREHAIGVARFCQDAGDPSTAEVAIVLRDDYQREGLGTALFDLLIQVALVRGLKRLRAVSLVENVAMHRLIRKIGLPYTSHTSRGETTVLMMLAGDGPTNDSGPGVCQGHAEMKVG